MIVMLCEKCQQREATIHLCEIADGRMRKSDLCEVCGKDVARQADEPMNFLGPEVGTIIARDPRYSAAAYQLVVEAISHGLMLKHGMTSLPADPHLSAAELLEVLRVACRLRFGASAKRQLKTWGITSCADFGEIVFNLADAGLMGQRPQERQEDFQAGYNFDNVFPES